LSGQGEGADFRRARAIGGGVVDRRHSEAHRALAGSNDDAGRQADHARGAALQIDLKGTRAGRTAGDGPKGGVGSGVFGQIRQRERQREFGEIIVGDEQARDPETNPAAVAVIV
jgi:hypothetical protein